MVDGKECIITVVRDDGLGDKNPTFTFDQKYWKIPNDGLEGFGGVDYELATQDYAQYDGAALLNERVGTCDRSITAYPYFDFAAARAEATSFFIPRRAYTVHCTYMGRTRYFTGRQYAFEFSVGNVYKRPTLKWTCLALEPMWLSEDSKSWDIAEAKGCFGFPFLSFLNGKWTTPDAESTAVVTEVSDAENPDHIKGFVVGVISNTVTMANDGNVQAYPKFVLTASSPVVKPSVTISDVTGATVCTFGVDCTLNDGDKLVVDFSARPTTIELNGTNISHKATAGSTLATGIEVGEFIVTWEAEDGDAALSVVPSIVERYTSI